MRLGARSWPVALVDALDRVGEDELFHSTRQGAPGSADPAMLRALLRIERLLETLVELHAAPTVATPPPAPTASAAKRKG